MAFSARQFARDDLPRLNAFISANAIARGAMPVYLMTTAGFDTPAQALYESCGFVRVGTCRTYLKRLA